MPELLDERAVSEIEAGLSKLRVGHVTMPKYLVAALCATVKHLRERERTILAVNAELIEGNHAAHVALDAAGIKREDVVWEGPVQHVTEYPVCDRIGFLQSRLAQVKRALEKL